MDENVYFSLSELLSKANTIIQAAHKVYDLQGNGGQEIDNGFLIGAAGDYIEQAINLLDRYEADPTGEKVEEKTAWQAAKTRAKQAGKNESYSSSQPKRRHG